MDTVTVNMPGLGDSVSYLVASVVATIILHFVLKGTVNTYQGFVEEKVHADVEAAAVVRIVLSAIMLVASFVLTVVVFSQMFMKTL